MHNQVDLAVQHLDFIDYGRDYVPTGLLKPLDQLENLAQQIEAEISILGSALQPHESRKARLVKAYKSSVSLDSVLDSHQNLILAAFGERSLLSYQQKCRKSAFDSLGLILLSIALLMGFPCLPANHPLLLLTYVLVTLPIVSFAAIWGMSLGDSRCVYPVQVEYYELRSRGLNRVTWAPKSTQFS